MWRVTGVGSQNSTFNIKELYGIELVTIRWYCKCNSILDMKEKEELSSLTE